MTEYAMPELLLVGSIRTVVLGSKENEVTDMHDGQGESTLLDFDA